MLFVKFLINYQLSIHETRTHRNVFMFLEDLWISMNWERELIEFFEVYNFNNSNNFNNSRIIHLIDEEFVLNHIISK